MGKYWWTIDHSYSNRKTKKLHLFGKIKSWKQVHEYYQLQADNYVTDKTPSRYYGI